MFQKVTKRRIVFVVIAGILAGSVFFFTFVPSLFDRMVNRTRLPKPYAISAEALDLHRQLRVVDWHSDALLSHRDLLRHGSTGHVDIPRLVEGNVALQAFTIVTRAPVRAGIPWLPLDWDAATALLIAQRRPVRTWTSTFERAMDAARRLHALETRADGQFRIIKSARELDAYLEDREQAPHLTAGFLGIEGLHCLEGDIAHLEAFFDAGIRMAGLVHLAGNDLGGAAHGIHRGGITPFGRDVVRRMEAMNMLIDLAHASPALLDDVLDMTTRPVVVSHTGFTGVHDNERNISDDHARRIADQGGLIAIAFFPWSTGGHDVASIIRMIKYGIDLVGAERLALGSDFDGSVTTPFDAAGVALITDGLLQEGVSREDIAKIMGENALQLLRQTLPPS